jgi:hypothetical protein
MIWLAVAQAFVTGFATGMFFMLWKEESDE